MEAIAGIGTGTWKSVELKVENLSPNKKATRQVGFKNSVFNEWTLIFLLSF